MNRPTFLHGVLAALVLSLLGAALAIVLRTLGLGFALRATIAAIAFGYVLYLVCASPGRSGRPSTLVLWFVAAMGLWLWWPPLLLFLLLHAVLIWLVRAFNHHRSLVAALADGVLTGVSLLAALWAFAQAGSVLAAAWCFLLVQALHVLIPAELPARSAPETTHADRFSRAHRQGEAALRRLLAES